MNKILIVGCGDIGRRLASHYIAAKHTGLQAWVSSTESACKLSVAEVRNLDNDNLAIAADVERIYWFAPPPKSGVTDTRVTRFLADNPQLSIQRLVYISTTAVYGDCDGEWIDETAPAAPGTERGQRRMDAEQQLTDAAERHGFSLAVLRVPGIYGPDRWPLARLEKQLPMLRAEDAPFTNRIHQDDLATAALAVMNEAPIAVSLSRIYNVSDGHPSTMTDYFNQIADAFGFKRPEQLARAEAEKALTPAMMSFLNESKRINAERLGNETSWQPQYQTLEQALLGVSK